MTPAQLRGRAEVTRREDVLKNVFQRANSLDHQELQLRSDFAKYLCVLVAGHLEKSIQELAQNWCRKKAHASVARYASRRLAALRNVNAQRLKELLQSFDPGWAETVSVEFADELVAIDGLMNLRNQIAHGVFVGTSIHDAELYLEQVSRLLDHLKSRFDPAAS